jgi:hypothetical protein
MRFEGATENRVRDSKALDTTCPLRVLAIESSCDETAVAILDEKRGLLAHQLFSQVDLHRIYGGVVPELASHWRKRPQSLRNCPGSPIRPVPGWLERC